MSTTPVNQSIEETETNEVINNSQDVSEVVIPEEEQKEKLLKLPLTRVKNIIKVDPEVLPVNREASILITKSTELFIESFIREAYKYTISKKKKVIHKTDIDNAVESIDSLMFLDDMLN